MTNQERIELIDNALEMISQAEELVSEALSGTNQEAEYNAYGKFGFNQLLGEGNPNDTSLDDVLERLVDEQE